MHYYVGQIIVHPHHGPATVNSIKEHKVGKGVKDYMHLAVHGTDLTVAVPLEKAEELGIRKIFDAGQLSTLFGTLREAGDEQEEQWSRRFKANREKISTGNMHSIAQVVRDLARRDDTKGLSSGERDMMRHARRPLVSEIGLSMGITEVEADAVLDSAIAGEHPPVGDEIRKSA